MQARDQVLISGELHPRVHAMGTRHFCGSYHKLAAFATRLRVPRSDARGVAEPKRRRILVQDSIECIQTVRYDEVPIARPRTLFRCANGTLFRLALILEFHDIHCGDYNTIVVFSSIAI